MGSWSVLTERIQPASPDLGCFHDERCQVRLARYQSRLRAMALELSMVAERERRSIAQGLHDDIGQSLAVARMRLEVLRRRLGEHALEEQLDAVLVTLADTIRASRRLTFELSPPLLYEFGLEAALRCQTARLESEHGVACRLDCDDASMPLSPDVAGVVHRVVRELLHNVVKHAAAEHAHVTIARSGDELRVEVADDGVGFAPAQESVPFGTGSGFGLFSAREQLLECGGGLEMVSVPGEGSRAIVTVPLDPSREAPA